MKHTFYDLFILTILLISQTVNAKNYDLTKYGLIPDNKENTAPILARIISRKGIYHFYPVKELEREYYISNHDQSNPKNTGIPLENLKNIVLDLQMQLFPCTLNYS